MDTVLLKKLLINEPMKKVSTIVFMVNDFNTDENLLIDFENFFEQSAPVDDFSDVFAMLNAGMISPSENVVKDILDFSKSYND